MLGVALVATTLVWFGLTLGLSFIETPLKFQAPGVTLTIGLAIGCRVSRLAACITLASSWVLAEEIEAGGGLPNRPDLPRCRDALHWARLYRRCRRTR